MYVFVHLFRDKVPADVLVANFGYGGMGSGEGFLEGKMLESVIC